VNREGDATLVLLLVGHQAVQQPGGAVGLTLLLGALLDLRA